MGIQIWSIFKSLQGGGEAPEYPGEPAQSRKHRRSARNNSREQQGKGAYAGGFWEWLGPGSGAGKDRGMVGDGAKKGQVSAGHEEAMLVSTLSNGDAL